MSVRLPLIILCLACCTNGCGSIESLENAGLIPGAAERLEARLSKEGAIQRDLYQETRSDEAFRWILGNRVKNGMTPGDINTFLGQEAIREYNDTRFKADGEGKYRADDVAWKWGPTEAGTTAILFFRKDRLVNFDGRDFLPEY